MRKQEAPDIDDKLYLDKIIKAKNEPRKARLKAVQGNISSAYDTFLLNLTGIHRLQATGIIDPERSDLHHCYDSSTAPLNELKEQIKSSLSDLDKDRCPYCSVRDPSEFDHYLPKSQFAEFSVFSKNLIWSCHKCNHKKLERHEDDAQFLHSYFHSIPNQKFLFCSISFMPEKFEIDFYLENPPGFDAESFSAISNHFTNLELDELYIRLGAQTLPNWKRRWQKLGESRSKLELKNLIIEFLTAEVETLKETYGDNYYEVAIIEELLENIDEFLSTLS